MQIQNTISKGSENNIDTAKYIPSSSDKKRAIMMYLILGIIVGLSKKNMNNFEYYHLKQAIGRWMIFILILVFTIVLLFIPVIKYLAIMPLIVLVVAWIISAKQAQDGKCFTTKKDSPLALFSGVGAWFIDLFEIGMEVPQSNIDDLGNLPDGIDSNQKQSDIETDIEVDINTNNHQ